MKQRIFIILAAVLLTGSAWAQTWTTNLTVNTIIPDNNPNGLAGSFAVGGLSGPIGNVTVTLDITGGYNGDLYGYLTGPNGGFAVLLNRSGLSAGNPNGYSNPGFNITLSDSAPNGNIHYYQNVVNPGGSQLTGTWAPDGRAIDPASAGSTFDSTLPTATFSSFIGNNPNGTWDFFLADLAPGDQSTLVNFGVTVTTVPEPQTSVLMGMAALVGFNQLRNRFRRK